MVVDGGRGAIFLAVFEAHRLVAVADAFHCVAVDDGDHPYVLLEMLAVPAPRPTTSAVVYCRNVEEECPRRCCIVHMVGGRYVCIVDVVLLAGA